MRIRVPNQSAGGGQTVYKYKTGLKGNKSFNLSTDATLSSVYKTLTKSNILIVVTQASEASSQREDEQISGNMGGWTETVSYSYTASSGALSISEAPNMVAGGSYAGWVDHYLTYDIYVYY